MAVGTADAGKEKITMKKIFALLLCCTVVLMSSLPVFAADAEDVPDTSITSGAAQDAGSAQDVGIIPPPKVSLTGGSAEPIEVRMETLGGVPYITKVYELASATSPLPASEAFEQEGYTFAMYDTFKEQLTGEVESRTATKTVTLSLSEDTPAALQAVARPYIEYSEDGFTGRLQYSSDDVTIESNGTTSYSYRVTDVREYTALDRNDAAYIPKTVAKDGATLTLEGIEWVVMGTVPDGDSLVPNLFKAIATYSGAASGSKSSGFTATINYSGTVTKELPGKVLYSVVFRGETAVADIAQTEDEVRPSAWPGVITAIGIVVVFAGAGVAAFLLIRRRRQMADEQAEIDELVEKGEW
jgi:hypothetical protein